MRLSQCKDVLQSVQSRFRDDYGMVLKQSIDDVLIGRDDGAERLMQRLPHAIPKPRRTHQDRPNGSGVSRQGTGKGLPACGGWPVAAPQGTSQTPTPDAGIFLPFILFRHKC